MIFQNKKAIILVGNSGSGKSSFSKSIEGFKILGKDYIRENLLCSEVSGCRFLKETEIIISIFFRKQLKFNANTGINLLVDETHTNRVDFDESFRILKNREYDITVYLFKTPKEICLVRNNLRQFPVPIEVIERKQLELEQIKPYLEHLNKINLIKIIEVI